jgi:HSP20 family molecular chaperone IbpA
VRPSTDVFETQDALVVIADVPGADEGSVELRLTDDILELRARPTLTVPEGWQPAGAEFELPDYERRFRITAELAKEPITATLNKGRLKVVLKKRQPTRIEVRGG